MTATPFARFLQKALLYWDLVDPSPLGRFRKRSRPVDGWLTRGEEAILFRLAQQVPSDQCIVELGSWFGRSAILLAGGSMHGRGAPVFAADLFQAAGCAKEALEARAGDAANNFWDRFHENMRRAGVAERVTAVRGETASLGEHWTGPPVGLIFIDADHSYDGVRRDWTSWRPQLARPARVAFHDFENPTYAGVTRFVNELVAAGAFRSVERHDSILCGEVADDDSDA